MKYKLINNPSTGDIITQTLINRQIKDINKYKNPDNNDDIYWMNYYGMENGVDMLKHHIEKNSNIGILVDCDCDGYMSSSIIYQYLKSNDIKPIMYFHQTKMHGLSEDIDMDSMKTLDLLIIPDAGSRDVEQVKDLNDNGVQVLIIDHHQADKNNMVKVNDDTVIINNQLEMNKDADKELTGAGMVFKFIGAMGYDDMDFLSQYASLGQIGDCSDYSKNSIRHLVFKGIKNISSKLILEAMKSTITDKGNITPIDLGYGFIPLVNAVCRVGSMEDRIKLFNGLNDVDMEGEVIKEKRKLNKKTRKYEKATVSMSKYESLVEDLQNIKKKQNTQSKKVVKELNIIEDGGMVIAVKNKAEVNSSTTGLVAQQLLRKKDKPALVLEERQDENGENILIGSARSNDKYIKDLRKWCEDTGNVVFAEGHDNSFGICIKKDTVNDFIKKSKNIKEVEHTYMVDMITDIILANDIEYVDNNRHLFGGSVSKPLIAYEDIFINKRDIKLTKGGMLSFYANGVNFVKFGVTEKEFNHIIEVDEGHVNMTFVGEPMVSYWLGRKNVQVVLTDYEIKANDNDFSDFDF